MNPIRANDLPKKTAAPPDPPTDADRRATELDVALGGSSWHIVLEDGGLAEVTSRELLSCLDKVHYCRRRGGEIPDDLHPLIPLLRKAVGVPPGEGTLPVLLISLLRSRS